jgi:hypothetical protein
VAIELLQSAKCVIQGKHRNRRSRCSVGDVLERYLLGAVAALARGLTPGVIDQNAPHHPGRDAEEMRTMLPIDGALFDEAEVRLVDQGGRLQRVARPLLAKLTRGDPAQLGVDQREQAIEGAAIAAAPVVEQRRDVMGRGHQEVEGQGDEEDRGSARRSQAFCIPG